MRKNENLYRMAPPEISMLVVKLPPSSTLDEPLTRPGTGHSAECVGREHRAHSRLPGTIGSPDPALRAGKATAIRALGAPAPSVQYRFGPAKDSQDRQNQPGPGKGLSRGLSGWQMGTVFASVGYHMLCHLLPGILSWTDKVIKLNSRAILRNRKLSKSATIDRNAHRSRIDISATYLGVVNYGRGG